MGLKAPRREGYSVAFRFLNPRMSVQRVERVHLDVVVLFDVSRDMQRCHLLDQHW